MFHLAKITTPIYYRLVIYRGSNLQLSGVYKDEDGETPIDLTGCVGYFVIGYTYQNLVDYIDKGETTGILFNTTSNDSNAYLTLGGPEGTFSIDTSWSEFTDFEPTGDGHTYKNYWWWFLLQYPDNTTEIIFYGPCEVI